MNVSTDPTVVFVIAVLVAISSQLASERMRMPPIFLWLIAGMLLGPFGFHVIQIESVEPALHTLVELGLAIILFEGGMHLNLKALHEHRSVVGRLVIFGPFFTILIGSVAAHTLTGLSWSLSILFGAIVSIGGPTVITPIIRQVRLDRNISHVLSSEAMLVDAVGAILAIVALQWALSSETDHWMIFQHIIEKLGVGSLIGVLGGWLLSRALLLNISNQLEMRTIFTLACAWGIFVFANALSEQAGLMAVLVAGATMQRMKIPDFQSLKHFKGSLSVLLISVLFVLLAAQLDLSLLSHNLWQSVVIFLLLAVVARPISAWCSGFQSTLTAPQVNFIALMAPRGVVVAAIGSLFGLLLQAEGIPQTELLTSLIFSIIILSVFIYGFLARPLSRWLHVNAGDERSVIIIGGGQMGAELGRALGSDREVRFLDTNGDIVKHLQHGGFTAVQGNALDPLYLEILHAEEVKAVIVMTGSSDHNLLIASLAKEHFHVPNIYVALQEEHEGKHRDLIHKLQARRLFAKPYTATYWHDQAFRKRLVHEIRYVEKDSPLIGALLSEIRIPHGVQPLAIIRNGISLIPHDDIRLEAGDEMALLLRPERIQEGQALILPPASDHSMDHLKNKES
ncbi:MAG: cation:proton antiporter [Zetaproteobacteria bacterium]|nr:cation:proton antiporter [Zetaproteobacteria bacterium]